MKKQVLYYTQVFYLDCALEYIKLASFDYSISLYIEISPEALHANIFDLTIDLEQYPSIVKYDDVKYDWKINSLESYFIKCEEVFFVVHPHKRSLSLNSFFRSLSLSYKIQKTKFDYIHLEDISLRTVGLLLYLFLNRNKLILNVHDPKAHSGEFLFKKELFKFIYYAMVKKFICFSNYSQRLLKSQLKDKQIEHINLLPYSYYQNFVNIQNSNIRDKISFVGRISKYKGIELFIEAIKIINEQYPNQEYQIAGKLLEGYNLDFEAINLKNVKVLNQHLSNNILVDIIQTSKLVVLPYLDATQSGVIMTAYALNCPVVVTPVGGLPEYVINKVTGIVANEVTAQAVADALILFFKNELSKNKNEFQMNDLKNYNIKQMKLIYSR
ncbi:glycosyltransferase involved in cell wall biosynthesis [Arcicella rosea]|uniref:glycosyltransferase family 4 protein n=1 Tax=Arcicella rosea TaxID=502909 RepID=UPI00345CE33F